jgi:CobQ-like glutamine amidotransferase family enzyme
MKLTIGYLYPDLMNTYGDQGNVRCVVQRCRWRGIDVEVRPISVGDPLDIDQVDLYFFGGGQDWQQVPVAADLQAGKGVLLRQAVEEGAALLSICGGFQLLAHYYRPFDGPDIPGAGLFDAWTVAGRRRMIGNTTVELTHPAFLGLPARTVVGFENHSGKTYLGTGCQPLGRVVVGYGNNGEDGWHGGVYRQAIGCYLHGSLLPKNPHLADYLIAAALRRRYGAVSLDPLPDDLEWRAHQAAAQRARQTGNPGLVRRG